MPRPAKRAERYVHPYDAAITMYRGRRADSPYWEAQIKLPDGKLVYRGTGAADKQQAEKIAYDRYTEIMGAIGSGRGIGVRKFRSAAELTVEQLQSELDESGLVGTAAHKYRKHITTIRNHLIPAFGDLPLSGIGKKDIEQYVASRKGRAGQSASKSTIRKHDHSLQVVFSAAREKGWISDADVRRLRSPDGPASIPRPTFTLEEFWRLHEAMTDEWVEGGRGLKGRETREILRELIVFIAFTGIRPGTEAFNVRRNDTNLLYFDRNALGPFTVIEVSRRTGKTARSRPVVGHKGDTKRLLDQAIRRLGAGKRGDDFLFTRRSDGKIPSDFHGAFEQLLTDTKLLFDADGDRRSLYSLRHFYAVQRLLEGFSYEMLSKQMGTSAKMLEEYYSSRVSSLQHAEKFSGIDFAAFARDGSSSAGTSNDAKPGPLLPPIG